MTADVGKALKAEGVLGFLLVTKTDGGVNYCTVSENAFFHTQLDVVPRTSRLSLHDGDSTGDVLIGNNTRF